MRDASIAMNVVAPDWFKQRRDRRYTPERDQYLRDHVGIDAAQLADDLHLSERFIISYQRKLGLRPFASRPVATFARRDRNKHHEG
jgi:hypothetical protein